MEVIKVEPDIDREALLLVSHSAISQLAIKEEDQSGAFTYVSVEPENKIHQEDDVGLQQISTDKTIQGCVEPCHNLRADYRSPQMESTASNNTMASRTEYKFRGRFKKQKFVTDVHTSNCTKCGVVFKVSKALTSNDVKSVVCKNCNVKETPEPINLADNIEQLQTCDTGSTFNGNRKEHPQNSTEGKPHMCHECGKRFTRSWALKKHYCLQEKPYVCEVCGKQFTQSRNLLVHSRSHTGEKPFVCTICSRGFSYSGDLKIHIRIHTGEKPHVCDVCKKAFSKQGKLKIHYRIHTGEKPYVCNICKKGFSESQVLKRHYHTHTGEKPHECPICKKGFTKPGKLKIHYRIHTGEKPYVCNVCNKGFNESQVLKKHHRIHTGEKPYKCTVCEKKFNDTQVLKEHYRTHTGEKPYVCSICMKSFAFSKSLKKHSQIHTGHPITNH
ncbi:hypothetical protein L798_11881 [Zootermopsis nevadensis]|uniref:C2H2-type domain-containing protein n=1 Tax=Zootermopsis nevadensis TaxID=136037 RepID=A0A067QY25_ZOONE|nr:hypothetical protein L798_11881 [Zootermopsis nevadensis]